MVPTKERNVTGIFLKYKAEGILFDCGEGSQRQMNLAGIKRHEVTKVLISHWHADHVSGLLGLIQTVSNELNEKKRLEIYGPIETKKRMDHLMKATIFDESKIDIIIHEVDPKGMETIFENEDFKIDATKLEHGIPCLGYRFIEKDRRKIIMSKAKAFGLSEGPLIGNLQKGKTVELNGKKITPEEVSEMVTGKVIAVMLDTTYCETALKLAEDADLLITESCYANDLEEKAEKYKHMTAKQCALVASNSGAKKLILTHFSQRYKTVDQLLEEASDIFPETEAAFDLMKVKI